MRVGIIGGGLAGLSSAIRLATAGHAVVLFEKNETIGGKLSGRHLNGHYFDMGPTLLTMPFILDDLYQSAGECLEDHLHLHRIDPTCTYHWEDGTQFRAWSNQDQLLEEAERCFPEDRLEFAQYLRDVERMFEATSDVFLYNPFRGLRELLNPANARLLPLLGSLGFTSTMHRSLARRFRSPKLIQLLDRFATYNGSNPYRAPATLNVISHVELNLGTWYPEGGMYAIIKSLQHLAEGLGVTIETSSEVTGLVADQRSRSIGGIVVNGITDRFDCVISNVDALWTWANLLEPLGFRTPVGLMRAERSCSGFLVNAGVRTNGQSVRGNDSHHSIYFVQDYEREFLDIFDRQILPKPMTIYRSISSKTDQTLSPEGEENWYLLVNAPAEATITSNVEERIDYTESIFSRLQEFGLNPDVMFTESIGPSQFDHLYNSTAGALYGTSSNSILSAFLRPGNRIQHFDNLFLASGSVHPGGGIPLVLLSAEITARMITGEGNRRRSYNSNWSPRARRTN